MEILSSESIENTVENDQEKPFGFCNNNWGSRTLMPILAFSDNKRLDSVI